MGALSQRQLNRTLLSRQMLLTHTAVKTDKAVERLVALQAQVASPPYFGLWARVPGFEPTQLMSMRDSGKVLRAPLLRSTLHWVTGADYRWIRPVIQPALEKAWQGFFGVRKSGITVDPLCQAARGILGAAPISLSALSDELLREFPDWNKKAMEYGVRTHLPLVQVPPAGSWKGGTAARYQLVDVDETVDSARLVRRYLAAFGPATARDVAVWAGFTSIGKALPDDLVEYRDEAGRVLYDLPGQEIMDGDFPAPVRFVAEYDNLVLSYADRSRILPEVHRKKVLLTAGRVCATVLIDGFVGGVWKLEREKKLVRLKVELFEEPSKTLRKAIKKEAAPLLVFAEAHELDVRWIV